MNILANHILHGQNRLIKMAYTVTILDISNHAAGFSRYALGLCVTLVIFEHEIIRLLFWNDHRYFPFYDDVE